MTLKTFGATDMGRMEKLGVRTIQQWCEKVEGRGWLSSKMGSSKKKKKKASGGEKAQEVEASE